MEKYQTLIKNPHFIKWLEVYAEVNHKLNGWLSNDLYLDEVELPRELYLCLLQKWLREVHGLVVESKISKTYFWYDWTITYKIKELNRIVSVGDPYQKSHETYEQALEVGLLEGLKLIKTNE